MAPGNFGCRNLRCEPRPPGTRTKPARSRSATNSLILRGTRGKMPHPEHHGQSESPEARDCRHLSTFNSPALNRNTLPCLKTNHRTGTTTENTEHTETNPDTPPTPSSFPTRADMRNPRRCLAALKRGRMSELSQPRMDADNHGSEKARRRAISAAVGFRRRSNSPHHWASLG